MTYLKTILLCVSLFVWSTCRGDDRVVTIAASTSGGMHAKTCWFLSVNSAREAELTIGYVAPFKRKFLIKEEQVESLLELIDSQNAFEMPSEYGNSAPDSVIRTLVVVVDKRVLHFEFYDFPDHASVSLKQLESACRISHAVRSWLDELDGLPKMLDHRPYELEAIKRLSSKAPSGN